MQIGFDPRPWWQAAEQMLCQVPYVVHSDPKGTWEYVIDWLTVISAIAVAVIAGMEIDRSRQDKNERRFAIDARIGVQAFPLRRQIESWLDETATVSGGNRLEWWANRAPVHFDEAEQRLSEMLIQAPDASPIVSSRLRIIRNYFYEATGLVNRAVVRHRAITAADIIYNRPLVEEVGNLTDVPNAIFRSCINEMNRLIGDRESPVSS